MLILHNIILDNWALCTSCTIKHNISSPNFPWSIFCIFEITHDYCSCKKTCHLLLESCKFIGTSMKLQILSWTWSIQSSSQTTSKLQQLKPSPKPWYTSDHRTPQNIDPIWEMQTCDAMWGCRLIILHEWQNALYKEWDFNWEHSFPRERVTLQGWYFKV